MCWNSDNCQFDESVLHIGCICVLSIILQAVTQPNFRGPFCKPIFSEKVSSLKIVITIAFCQIVLKVDEKDLLILVQSKDSDV